MAFSRLAYRPELPLVAARPFLFEGRNYQPGDAFEAGDHYRRRLLWRRRYVDVAPETTQNPAPETSRPPQEARQRRR